MDMQLIKFSSESPFQVHMLSTCWYCPALHCAWSPLIYPASAVSSVWSRLTGTHPDTEGVGGGRGYASYNTSATRPPPPSPVAWWNTALMKRNAPVFAKALLSKLLVAVTNRGWLISTATGMRKQRGRDAQTNSEEARRCKRTRRVLRTGYMRGRQWASTYRSLLREPWQSEASSSSASLWNSHLVALCDPSCLFCVVLLFSQWRWRTQKGPAVRDMRRRRRRG